MSLQPTAILQADYGIAQTPVLGGEIEVWATTEPSQLIMSVRCMEKATTYETTLYNEGAMTTPVGVNVVVVGSRGVTRTPTEVDEDSDGLGAHHITVPLWSTNKSPRFPSGKAGEASGNGLYEATHLWGIRGEVMDQIQIPDFDPTDEPKIWYNVGCTTERRLKLPTRMSKAIACQMESSKFVVPGKTEIGELSVTAYNQGHEEGLLRISGLKTTVMLRVFKESVLEVARIFIIDWTPTIERTDPAGEAESTVQATGLFSKFAAISAEGTP